MLLYVVIRRITRENFPRNGPPLPFHRNRQNQLRQIGPMVSRIAPQAPIGLLRPIDVNTGGFNKDQIQRLGEPI